MPLRHHSIGFFPMSVPRCGTPSEAVDAELRGSNERKCEDVERKEKVVELADYDGNSGSGHVNQVSCD